MVCFLLILNNTPLISCFFVAVLTAIMVLSSWHTVICIVPCDCDADVEIPTPNQTNPGYIFGYWYSNPWNNYIRLWLWHSYPYLPWVNDIPLTNHEMLLLDYFSRNLYSLHLKNWHWHYTYTPAYTNISGYVIGLMFGYIFYRYRGQKILTKKVNLHI